MSEKAVKKERKDKGVKAPQRGAVGASGEAGRARVLRGGAAPARLLEETDREYDYFVAFWQKGAAMSLRGIARELASQPRRAGFLAA